MCQMIKQASWSGRTGSFKENRNNPLGSITVKLSQKEVAGLLYAMDRNKEVSEVHTSERQSVQIRFTPYIDKQTNEQRGFSFGITKTILPERTDKVGIVIGLDFKEMRLLREYLIHLLNKSFEYNKKEGNQEPQPEPQQEQQQGDEQTDAPVEW